MENISFEADGLTCTSADREKTNNLQSWGLKDLGPKRANVVLQVYFHEYKHVFG